MPSGKTSCFADTNLIVYATDPSEIVKRVYIRDVLVQIIVHHILVLSPQSLNECYRVVTEKRSLMPRNDARRLVAALQKYSTAPYNFEVTQRAWEIQDQHGYGWWDSMLLGSALLAGCQFFLSEDMQHERDVGGMTIIDPFKVDQTFFPAA